MSSKREPNFYLRFNFVYDFYEFHLRSVLDKTRVKIGCKDDDVSLHSLLLSFLCNVQEPGQSTVWYFIQGFFKLTVFRSSTYFKMGQMSCTELRHNAFTNIALAKWKYIILIPLDKSSLSWAVLYIHTWSFPLSFVQININPLIWLITCARIVKL